MTRRRKNRWKRRALGVLALLLVGVASYGFQRAKAWAMAEGRFPIREVRVKGNDLLWEGEILEIASVERGKNLLRLDVDGVEERLSRSGWVREARVRRIPPGRVDLKIEEREPWMLLLEGRDALFVDREGAVFPALGKEQSLDLPILVDRSGRPGEIVAELAKAFPAADDWLGRRVAEVEIDEEGSVSLWEIPNRTRILLGGEAFPDRVARLRAVLADWDRKSEQYGEVDLRFANQVIAREPIHERKKSRS
jgi:cell division protein FtsQ